MDKKEERREFILKLTKKLRRSISQKRLFSMALMLGVIPQKIVI
jgi:hypothetical protein